MRTVGYVGAPLGGIIADAMVGLLIAPQGGKRICNKISDTVDNSCKRHGIKLLKKDVDNLVDDIKGAASDIVE